MQDRDRFRNWCYSHLVFFAVRGLELSRLETLFAATHSPAHVLYVSLPVPSALERLRTAEGKPVPARDYRLGLSIGQSFRRYGLGGGRRESALAGRLSRRPIYTRAACLLRQFITWTAGQRRRQGPCVQGRGSDPHDSPPNVTPANVVVDCAPGTPVSDQGLELVERKGLGHPDTICDLLAETMSQALCRLYLEETGHVLHYNIENGFLVAGSSTPGFGGGRVERPMRFVYGDTATMTVDGRPLPVEEVVSDAARAWFVRTCRWSNPSGTCDCRASSMPGQSSSQTSSSVSGSAPTTPASVPVTRP